MSRNPSRVSQGDGVDVPAAKGAIEARDGREEPGIARFCGGDLAGRLQLALEQARVDVAGQDFGMAHDIPEETRIRAHPLDVRLVQRGAQPCERGAAVGPPHDDLGEHRVVVDADLVSGLEAAVDANCHARRRKPKALQASGGRKETAFRVLCVQSRLDGMTAAGDPVLRERQSFARCDAKLPFDEVETGDHLRHRVLHLQPGVHLEEIEPAAVVQELDRAGALVIHRARRGNGRRTHGRARLFSETGGRGFLDHFLVPTLQRAVALEQVHGVAVRIREHLDLDVPARLDEALEQNAIVAEGPGRLATRAGERLGQFRGRSHDPHALAAATGGRLDEQRKTQAFGFLPQVLGRLLGAVVTGQHRHASGGHQAARLALRPHPQDR